MWIWPTRAWIRTRGETYWVSIAAFLSPSVTPAPEVTRRCTSSGDLSVQPSRSARRTRRRQRLFLRGERPGRLHPRRHPRHPPPHPDVGGRGRLHLPPRRQRLRRHLPHPGEVARLDDGGGFFSRWSYPGYSFTYPTGEVVTVPAHTRSQVGAPMYPTVGVGIQKRFGAQPLTWPEPPGPCPRHLQ